MKLRITLIATTLAATGLVSGTAQAAFYQRVGGLYDDVLDVTWGGVWGYTSWQLATDTAANDTSGGSTTWRLPTISELTSLYNEPTMGFPYLNLANFGNGLFWSSEEEVYFVMGQSSECDYQTSLCIIESGKSYKSGGSYPYNIGDYGVVVEVMSGDIAPVPEPEAWGLMLSGLALVGAAAKRRHG